MTAQGKPEIKVMDVDENLAEFSAFMKGEKIFEIQVPIEAPDGRTFKIPLVYEPNTAFTVAKVYEGSGDNLTPEEQFEYMATLFNKASRNWTWTNKPAGSSNYMEHEISVQDLNVDTRKLLEAALNPGIGEDTASINKKLVSNRRQVGKGNRRKPAKNHEQADQRTAI